MPNSRKKGHSYELVIAKKFREILGYEDCVTSRSESKRTDDEGIDLCYTYPFQAQAKAWEKAPAYHDVLAGMPQRKGRINVVFHKRNRKGTVVVMKEEDWFLLMKLLLDHKLLPNDSNNR